MIRYVVAIAAVGAFVWFAVADAAPTIYSPATAENLTRPCSYSGKTSTNVSTTAASAATASALASGVVRVICTQAVHFRLSTTAAPTAVTTDTLLPANTVEWIVSETDYFAAIRDSADGTCYLTVCR